MNVKQKLNKKGFTLAEMLIVVAIIAILVAVAIPVFSSQLDKARLATDHANIRSAYAAATVAMLDDKVNATGGTGYFKINDNYFFGANGEILTSTTGAYKTKAAEDAGKCETAAKLTGNHTKNKYIIVKFTAADAFTITIGDGT